MHHFAMCEGRGKAKSWTVIYESNTVRQIDIAKGKFKRIQIRKLVIEKQVWLL